MPNEAARTHRPRRRFQSLAEIGAVPPRMATIAGLLAPGDLALLTGPAKSGKSTLAAGLAASVSRGEPFFGQDCEPGSVAYIAAERRDSVARRLRAADALLDEVHLADWTPDLIKQAVEIIEAIQEASVTPSLIVLDTLARCIPGADENSSRDMGLANASLNKIQRAFPTAAIIVLHHTGKSGAGARGSSAIIAGVDMELTVKARKGGGTLTLERSNYSPPDQGLPFRIQEVDVDGGPELVVVLDDSPESAETQKQYALKKGRERRTAEFSAWAEKLDKALPSALPAERSERIKIAKDGCLEIGRIKPTDKPDTQRKTAERLLKQVEENRNEKMSKNAV